MKKADKNTLNLIGLNTHQCDELALHLNELLANYSIFYQNLRGYHWNIRGEKFFELHLKFEELYNDIVIKIDEVAERILTLGHTPEHRYSKYLKLSDIEESKPENDGKSAVSDIIKAFGILLIKQRVILSLSEKAGDEGTNALMSDYIRAQEKLVWMFSAYKG
jgi:starvation-inducible DNA-binding protein